MVYIPQPGYTPFDNPPDLNITLQTRMNREATHWFISLDPTAVSLVPREEVKTATGGTRFQNFPPRPQQIVKLINQSGTSDAIRIAQDGAHRRYDFVLVAEWDATIHLLDFWEDPGKPDHFWQVTAIEPYNGYEVKAGITAHGKELTYGG